MPAPAAADHFIFVDFENVPSVDLAWIADRPVHVTLVVGEKQRRLELPLVRQIHQLARQVTLIEAGASGRNALDLVLAAYLGHATLEHPGATFTIVSKDKDFDPLIAHLRARGVRVARHPDLASAGQPAPRARPAAPRERAAVPRSPAAPAARAGTTPPRPRRTASPRAPVAGVAPPERVSRIVERLTSPDGPRPKRADRLRHYLDTCVGRALTDDEQNELVDHLAERGILTIDADGKVWYPPLSDVRPVREPAARRGRGAA